MSNPTAGADNYSSSGNSRRPQMQQRPARDKQNSQTDQGKMQYKENTGLSRLDQMRNDFQQKRMKEREENMIRINEENERKMEQRMERLNQGSGKQNKGMLRDFFNERRAENNNSGESLPSRDIHLRQKKQEYQPKGSSIPKPIRGPNGYALPQKNSAGRDRANPLVPIDRKAYDSGSDSSSASYVAKPPNGRKLGNLRGLHKNSGTGQSGASDYYSTEENLSQPTSQNAPKSKIPRQQRANTQNLRRADSSDEDLGSTYKVENRNAALKKNEKLSSFQKWKVEQDEVDKARKKKWLDQQKTETLQNQTRFADEDENNEASYEEGESDYEEAEGGDTEQLDIEKQQREILSQIEKKQRELEKMTKQREQEQREEKKEEKRRQKREAAEKARKKKVEEMEARMAREREEQEEEMSLLNQNRDTKNTSNQISHNNKDIGNSRAESSGISRVSNKGIEHKQTVKPKPKPKYVPPKPKSNKRDTTVSFTEMETGGPVEHSGGDDYVRLVEQLAEEAEGGSLDFARCGICGRQFASDRIQKHQTVCAKNSTKKRKVFDQVKMRTEGTDAAQFVDKTKTRPEPKAKKTDWRRKRESFIEGLRYAKKCAVIEAKGGKVGDLPPPPKSDTSDLTTCPTCNRKFNITAAERHIPWCEEQARKKQLKQGAPRKGRR